MPRQAPQQKPGKSRQDFETPWDFVAAVEAIFDLRFTFDLAADEFNTKAPNFFSAETDSLKQDWQMAMLHEGGWGWLNPPFGMIARFAQKACESGIRVAMLVPASRGAQWYRDWVENRAYEFDLYPRISFDEKGPYPKDCMLVLYGTPFRGRASWGWK